MSRSSFGHAALSRLWKPAAEVFAIRNPIDFATARSWTMMPLRCFTSRLRISWRLIILWYSAPRSLTGCRSPGSASASRAIIRASFLSFLAFESVTILRRHGFAT